MFSRTEGPIDEHIWALFQYTPFALDGLFVSTDFCTECTDSKAELESEAKNKKNV